MTVKGEFITDEDRDLWYLRQLDGGLFTLQTVDYILGWIIMEDDGVSTTIGSQEIWVNRLSDPNPCNTDVEPQRPRSSEHCTNPSDLP